MSDIQKITLDFKRSNSVLIKLHQYDKNSTILQMSCTSNGQFIKLDSSTNSCKMKVITYDDRKLYKTCTVNTDGTVSITLDADFALSPGLAYAELNVINTKEQSLYSPLKFRISVEESVYSNDAVIADDSFD